MIPWDKMPLDELREHEIEKGDIDKVVAKLKGLTLVLAIGLRDDYLIAASVESTDVLASLGKGEAAGQPAGVQAASGLCRQEADLDQLSQQGPGLAWQASPQDIDDLVNSSATAWARRNCRRTTRPGSASDAVRWPRTSSRGFAKPGAKMGFSYLTATGCESYVYDWGPLPRPTLPGRWAFCRTSAAIRWWRSSDATRTTGSPTICWPRLAVHGPLLLRQIRPAEDEVRRAGEVQEVRIGGPAAGQRFDAATRKFLLPALADGQGGLVLDARFTTKQIAAGVPEMERPCRCRSRRWSRRQGRQGPGRGRRRYREVVNGLLAEVPQERPRFDSALGDSRAAG